MPEDKADKFKAQEEWKKRHGLGRVTFNPMSLAVVDEFKQKCDERKEKYAAILTKLMKRYIESPEEFED